MQKICIAFVAALALISCGQKELLPGEDRFLAELEAAEQKIEAQGSAACGELKQHYVEAESAFKQMMPSLKGLGLQKRDTRLGKLREFTEDNC